MMPPVTIAYRCGGRRDPQQFFPLALSAVESVGEAAGVVRTWPSGREHVHWDCPLCGRLHISDFDPHADGNPVLWFCEAGDGRLCLVHWRRADAEPASMVM